MKWYYSLHYLAWELVICVMEVCKAICHNITYEFMVEKTMNQNCTHIYVKDPYCMWVIHCLYIILIKYFTHSRRVIRNHVESVLSDEVSRSEIRNSECLRAQRLICVINNIIFITIIILSQLQYYTTLVCMLQ